MGDIVNYSNFLPFWDQSSTPDVPSFSAFPEGEPDWFALSMPEQEPLIMDGDNLTSRELMHALPRLGSVTRPLRRWTTEDIQQHYEALIEAHNEYCRLHRHEQQSTFRQYRAQAVHGLHTAENRATWMVLAQRLQPAQILSMDRYERRQHFLGHVEQQAFASTRTCCLRLLSHAGMIEELPYQKVPEIAFRTSRLQNHLYIRESFLHRNL
ncbi:hypothetical protein GF342_00715 [Candidatus Woesearchaeota archaeon]|nr:hypothetical protein [Candidatus Woesearchaeota archaeon]